MFAGLVFPGPDESDPHAFRRRVVLVGAGILVLAILGVLVLLRAAEPRYLGRTTDEWFPRWVQRGSVSSRIYPAAARTNETSEFLPILIRAGQARTELSEVVWKIAADTVPDDWLLRVGRPVRADEVRSLAVQLMARNARQVEFAEALAAEFPRLDEAEQIELLRNLGRFRIAPEAMMPLFDRLLDGPGLRLPVWVASIVSTSPDLARPRAARLLGAASVAAGDANLLAELFVPMSSVVYRSATWGGLSREGVVLLEQLATRENPGIRMASRLTLVRVDPQNHPAERLFRDELPGMSSAELDEVARFFRFGLGGSRRGPFATGPEVLTWMLMALQGEEAPLATPANAAGSERKRMLAFKSELLRAMSQFSNPSRALHDAALGMVGHDDASLRRTAAEALERMGPLFPDAVPKIGANLAVGHAPLPLLRLLGRYQRLPSELEPLVTELAAGRVPTGRKGDSPIPGDRTRRSAQMETNGVLQDAARKLLEQSGRQGATRVPGK